ncbi:MAG: GNAT family N-acetyltransferase, partial [Gammaproteobacteria bacterium]|nr:GNAT family N-acetyltransferase [Gammaproteobacteria bacterium]
MTIKIRPYHPADLYDYYQICLLTGASGKDASGSVEDELLG